jgi:hypothetical protein
MDCGQLFLLVAFFVEVRGFHAKFSKVENCSSSDPNHISVERCDLGPTGVLDYVLDSKKSMDKINVRVSLF